MPDFLPDSLSTTRGSSGTLSRRHDQTLLILFNQLQICLTSVAVGCVVCECGITGDVDVRTLGENGTCSLTNTNMTDSSHIDSARVWAHCTYLTVYYSRNGDRQYGVHSLESVQLVCFKALQGLNACFDSTKYGWCSTRFRRHTMTQHGLSNISEPDFVEIRRRARSKHRSPTYVFACWYTPSVIESAPPSPTDCRFTSLQRFHLRDLPNRLTFTR